MNKLFAFATQIETKTKNDHIESKNTKKKSGDPGLWRDVLAYWILGLGTEFGYVVMICAANDILHGFGHSSVNDFVFLFSEDYLLVGTFFVRDLFLERMWFFRAMF